MGEVPLYSTGSARNMVSCRASGRPEPVGQVLERPPHPQMTNLTGEWLQCQANGSNVCRVLRHAPVHLRTSLILTEGGSHVNSAYRVYKQMRTRTALGSYSRALWGYYPIE